MKSMVKIAGFFAAKIQPQEPNSPTAWHMGIFIYTNGAIGILWKKNYADIW